jgi:hypothetical protein
MLLLFNVTDVENPIGINHIFSVINVPTHLDEILCTDPFNTYKKDIWLVRIFYQIEIHISVVKPSLFGVNRCDKYVRCARSGQRSTSKSPILSKSLCQVGMTR